MQDKFKTSKGRKYQRKQKLTAKPKAKVSASVKAYVKKAIDIEVEDKQDVLGIFTTQGTSNTGKIVGYGINNTTTFTGIHSNGSIIPNILQGITSDTRIGNKIKVKDFYVRYHIVANAIAPTVNVPEGLPFYVVVVFYNRKDSKTNPTNDTMMEYGATNTSLVFLNDLTLDFNKDVFNILGFYKHKMYPSQKLDVSGLSTPIVGVSGYVPAVMKKVKVKIPSKLQYDDNSAQPTTTRVFCSVGVFNVDNSRYIPSQTIRANVELTSHIVYQDA